MNKLKTVVSAALVAALALGILVGFTGAASSKVRVAIVQPLSHKSLDQIRDTIVAELKASDGAHREKLATELATLKTTQEAQTKTLQRMESKVDRILEDGCYRANEFHKDGAR